MKLSATLLALPILALTMPLHGQTTEAPKKPDQDGTKMICKTDDQIGTRVRKRKICMTRDEWRQVNVESSMTLERNTAQLARPGGS